MGICIRAHRRTHVHAHYSVGCVGRLLPQWFDGVGRAVGYSVGRCLCVGTWH